MKKLFIKEIFFLPLLILTLFISVNKVSALDNAYFSNFYIDYENIVSDSSNYNSIINNLISYYNENFSNDFSDYFITFLYNSSELSQIELYATNSLEFYAYNSNGSYFLYKNDTSPSKGYLYNSSSSLYNEFNYTSYYFSSLLYSSSSNIIFVDSSNCSANISSNCFNSFTISSYSNLNLNVFYPLINIDNGDIIPTYLSLVNGLTAYTEINLNNYNSVILSLKDYTSRNSFNTIIPTLGQLCLTPVYDYGMKNKGDYYPGYEVQGCTPQYSEFTPVSVSILSSDINNHAVYYVKPYNTSIENKIKVDTTIFDITYVTSENANNPTVTIGGRSYPVIPYSDLSSSATTSTENGYIPGASCQLGDLNCQASVSGMDISDLFTHPLELLKDMWSAITSVFTIITAFILLLPTPLQAFMYSAFMLAIVLGIIKIIL